MARAIANLIKIKKQEETQNCSITFGKNENQTSHTTRHLSERGIDTDLAKKEVTKDLNRLNSEGKITDGLNKGTVNVNGTTVDYNAFRFQDGTINVGRMTPR